MNEYQDDAPGETAFFSRGAFSAIPWLLGAKGFTFFLYLAASVVTVRGLGAHLFGVYSLCKSLATYLVAFCGLGLNVAMLRYIPETLVKGHGHATQRLFLLSALGQLLMALLVGMIAYPFAQVIGQWLQIPFSLLYFPTWALLLGLLTKSYLSDALTAVYLSKELAGLSLLQGSLWLGALVVLFSWGYSLVGVLWGQVFSLAITGVLGLGVLWRYAAKLPLATTGEQVAVSRMARLCLPVFVSSMLNQLTMRYTEILFLGSFHSPSVVGYYELGYSIPLLLITFFPMTLHTLFTSAFAEAYTKDSRCLPDLLVGVFEIIMVVAIPIACFSWFFLPRAVVLVYGQEMAPAGWLAAFFSMIHLLPLLWGPLSMAITAVEKNMQTLWLQFLQLGVNVLLDVLLIPTYGLNGAVAAVTLTFVLTLPLQLWFIRRLVGGIYFPLGFFGRIFAPAFLVAAVLGMFWPQHTLVDLTAAAALYGLALVATIRWLGLVWEEDVRHFRYLRLPAVEWILALFIGGKRS